MADRGQDGAEPMFNIPRVVLVLVLLSLGVFAGQNWYLGDEARTDFFFTFCFAPDRYAMLSLGQEVNGGWGAALWTPFTYIFLNLNISTLLFEMLWLVAFGSAVAFRFGPARFLLFVLLAAGAGAGFFAVIRPADPPFLYGPGFVVSALLGAAVRFVYQAGFQDFVSMDAERWKVPALGIVEMWSNVQVLRLFCFIFLFNGLFSVIYVSSGFDARLLLLNALGYATGIVFFSILDRRRPVK